ncbi:AraC family transcriptional regulator [Telluria mixta]|uniref:AraC family transcriptional regulator n=1 Tax=Telluria mixta TaxID=34071 RepID=A0ABT2BSL7_9BURK|nr:AraC family transcriptional regulator [Telluria mixta]MCS0628108.1 AraC family transcriptional regulator [Telluria mixta]WEM93776.1 AraC family transcriptional regulator [Telluria mixta]
MDDLRQQRIIGMVREYAPSEGYTLSRLDGVRFMRADGPITRVPVMYEPSIVIVCQGRKRGFLDDAVYTYDPHHYLVLSVPLPFESDTQASPEEPMLAVAVSIDLKLAAELVLLLDARHRRQPSAAAGMCSTPLDDAMSDTLLRLLQALGSEDDARVLGPGIVRELLYRVLTGPQGGAVHAALNQQSHFGRIGKALRRIHANYDRPVDVATLASDAGMSVAAFHAHFKAVTRTTPIQYLKTTRLHKARLLMVQDGVNAATASHMVGYESSSQFSREFKRFFGRTPAHEAAVMKSALIQMPAQPASAYVTMQ